MSERISILNEIKNGGYEASLITTFNAYLPFYEDVVLRHLMGSGIRHNVLMMDASQATLAVDRHPPRSAGRFYTLAPIQVAGAFHPKVVFLVGKKKGTLLVGSHNLTLSGFGYNREMTNVILCKGEDDAEGIALLSSAWQFILDWAESQSDVLPGHIIDMVKKVQDFAPWLQKSVGTLPVNCRVLSAGSKTPALWQQLTEFIGSEPIQRVTINGAFFDSNLSFVDRVRDELSPKELLVGIDPETVQFPVHKKLTGVSFHNCSKLGTTEKDNKPGYLHAKSLLIQYEDGEAVLAVGSANPSYPAWLAPGITQNVEIMLARKGVDAKEAAEELGLLAIDSMDEIKENDWLKISENWQRDDQSGQPADASQVVIALASDSNIKFKVSGNNLPGAVECEIIVTGSDQVVKRQAKLIGSEYVLSTEGLSAQPSIFRFCILDRQFTVLVQHVKQIEGLSRTSSQRRFNDALSSLATGMPNLEHFVDCIKEIIKISDTVAITRGTKAAPAQGRNNQTTITQQEGAELSIGLDEVVEQEHLRKQRLRGSDDLAYLLDVLLYNLRDENPVVLDDVLENRDAMGRSEEEQVDADDEDEAPLLPVKPVNDQDTPPTRNPLDVCHYKVSTLVGMACEKLDALKQGRLEMAQFVVIMAGILSALRLLRGLDGKVPWIAAGQTAVPKKELRKLFNKIAEVAFDGDKSIISLAGISIQLSDFDEFARLKGLIIWLAWNSGITITDRKPFNESAEERTERFDTNRLYVATAQLIAGDEDTISEARQSIGQFSSIDMGWLDKLLAVDQLIRNAFSDPTALQDGTTAKAGDFGFNTLNPASGIREILPTGGSNIGLAWFNSDHPRFKFPTKNIRTIPFTSILKT